MTTTYVGFYRPASPEAQAQVLRETGTTPPEFDEKRRRFLDGLPASCKLIGSWSVTGDSPSVMVVEAEGWDDLLHITMHYAGYLTFTWHPTATGGVGRS